MNLFIDTHLNRITIILEENGKIIKSKIVEDKKQSSQVMMPLIKKMLAKSKPESIIIVNGPGSFTGVRLGVTIAKTLAYTLNIPIRTITSLECMAVNINGSEKIVAFSDNNGYYVGIFDGNNKLVGNYEYLSNDLFNEFSNKYNVVQEIEVDYQKVIDFALLKSTVNPHEVNPLYIKKLDVEK